MFWVIAIIQATSIEPVRKSLENVGIQAMTISECSGHGRQLGKTETYRGHEYHAALVAKAKVEVGCSQGEISFVVDAIRKGAKSAGEGRIGDGKIFVIGMEECVRIRTGESGKNAL